MNSSILKRFSVNIKKLRAKKGWSQDELGKRAGLHRTYVGSIERNERNVSLINLERIARAFNVNPTQLIK